MTEDDPRHGAVAGYQAHRRSGVPVCGPCLRAKSRYEKARKIYGEQMVPAVGTRRRIQALKALGFSGAEIGAHLGVSYQAVHRLETSTATKMFAPTASSVADLYDRLVTTSPIGRHRLRMRNLAAARGYALPHQWFNIDDPDESPDPGYDAVRSHNEVDHVLIDRILGGDMSLARAATKAEKVEVITRWRDSGRPLNELERVSGWEPRRYLSKDVA